MYGCQLEMCTEQSVADVIGRLLVAAMLESTQRKHSLKALMNIYVCVALHHPL